MELIAFKLLQAIKRRENNRLSRKWEISCIFTAEIFTQNTWCFDFNCLDLLRIAIVTWILDFSFLIISNPIEAHHTSIKNKCP